MALARKEARNKAMTILYQINLYKKNNINYIVEEIINEINEEKDEFVNILVNGVIENEQKLKDTAEKYLNNWRLERLGLTDQAIIEIAIYELLYTDTPEKVVIDEAIELAHDFSDEKVVGMINGVLDKVYHNKG